MKRPDGFVDEELAVRVLEEPVDRLNLGDELFGRDELESDAALQQLGSHAHAVLAVEVKPLQQRAEHLHLRRDIEIVVRQDPVQPFGRQVHEMLCRRHLHHATPATYRPPPVARWTAFPHWHNYEFLSRDGPNALQLHIVILFAKSQDTSLHHCNCGERNPLL